MSVATVVTRGFGSFGSAAFVVTRGYSIGAAVVTAPPAGEHHGQAKGGGGGPGGIGPWTENDEKARRKYLRELDAEREQLNRKRKADQREVQKLLTAAFDGEPKPRPKQVSKRPQQAVQPPETRPQVLALQGDIARTEARIAFLKQEAETIRQKRQIKADQASMAQQIDDEESILLLLLH